jgi:hypothetical protein
MDETGSIFAFRLTVSTILLGHPIVSTLYYKSGIDYTFLRSKRLSTSQKKTRSAESALGL